MIINESRLKERLELEKKLQEIKKEDQRKAQEKINNDFNSAIKELNTFVEESRDVIDTIDEILKSSVEFYFHYIKKPLEEKFPKFGYDERICNEAFYLIHENKISHETLKWSSFPYSGVYYVFPTVKGKYSIQSPIVDSFTKNFIGYDDHCSRKNHYEYEVNLVTDFTCYLRDYIKEFTKIINEL